MTGLIGRLPPVDFPITGLCIVSDPEKCPPCYELLIRSNDKNDDCDLWKDKFFKARNLRYLCFTRVFPLDDGRLNNVLADIVMINEREMPPPQFSMIEKTLDTGEKATRKKTICVRMIPRSSTTSAICDIAILSRNKAPPGYSTVGELNGLLLCYKIGPFTNDQTSVPYNAINQLSLKSSPASKPEPARKPVSPIDEHKMSAVSGVPFELNTRLANKYSGLNSPIPAISYRSHVDIDNEFHYAFCLERNTQLSGS